MAVEQPGRGMEQERVEDAVGLGEIQRAPGLLERHSRFRTSHASLIAEVLNLLAGGSPTPPSGDAEPLRESLSDSEKRILRYLPTHLSAPEIAGELYLSVDAVKAHLRTLFGFFGVEHLPQNQKRSYLAMRALQDGVVARRDL